MTIGEDDRVDWRKVPSPACKSGVGQKKFRHHGEYLRSLRFTSSEVLTLVLGNLLRIEQACPCRIETTLKDVSNLAGL